MRQVFVFDSYKKRTKHIAVYKTSQQNIDWFYKGRRTKQGDFKNQNAERAVRAEIAGRKQQNNTKTKHQHDVAQCIFCDSK
jgi:hypothetical protein